MTPLIEDLEQSRYPVKPVSPVAMLRRLMEEPGLKQKDLLDVFGTGSAVSQVLNHRGRTAFNRTYSAPTTNVKKGFVWAV